MADAGRAGQLSACPVGDGQEAKGKAWERWAGKRRLPAWTTGGGPVSLGPRQERCTQNKQHRGQQGPSSCSHYPHPNAGAHGQGPQLSGDLEAGPQRLGLQISG